MKQKQSSSYKNFLAKIIYRGSESSLNYIVRFFGSDLIAKTLSMCLIPFFAFYMGPAELGRFAEWFTFFNLVTAVIGIGIPSYLLVVLAKTESVESYVLGQFKGVYRQWHILLLFVLLFAIFCSPSAMHLPLASLYLCSICYFHTDYYLSIFRHTDKPRSYFITQLSLSIVTNGIPFLFVLFTPTSESRIFGLTGGLVVLALTVKATTPLNVTKAKPKAEFRAKVYKFGLPITLISAAAWLKFGLDLQLVKVHASYALAGHLAFANRCTALVSIVAAALNRASTVKFYELLNDTSLREWQRLIRLLSLSITFLILLIFVSGYVLIEVALPEYRPSIYFLLPMLLAQIPYALGQFIASKFYFREETFKLTICVIGASLLHPLTSYLILTSAEPRMLGMSYLVSNCAFLSGVLLLSESK
jgi:O-antigen/teichoic acid export membrane protein